MKLTTNLATRRYINARQLDTALVLFLLLLCAACVSQVRGLAHNAAELARIRGVSEKTGVHPAGQRVSETQLKALSARISFANLVIERKTVNWIAILDDLEEVVPSGVALTQIEPGQREQPLKLAGVARTFADLRTLVENMERSAHFSEVYLLNQGETKVGLTQHGVVFSIACKVGLP